MYALFGVIVRGPKNPFRFYYLFYHLFRLCLFFYTITLYYYSGGSLFTPFVVIDPNNNDNRNSDYETVIHGNRVIITKIT